MVACPVTLFRIDPVLLVKLLATVDPNVVIESIFPPNTFVAIPFKLSKLVTLSVMFFITGILLILFPKLLINI